MNLLKSERIVLAALMEGAAPGTTAEELAEDIIAEYWRLLGERGSLNFALVKLDGGFYHTLGPFSTPLQAGRSAAKHPAALAAHVCAGYTPAGLDALIARVDEPAVVKGDWAQIADDVARKRFRR